MKTKEFLENLKNLNNFFYESIHSNGRYYKVLFKEFIDNHGIFVSFETDRKDCVDLHIDINGSPDYYYMGVSLDNTKNYEYDDFEDFYKGFFSIIKRQKATKIIEIEIL